MQWFFICANCVAIKMADSRVVVLLVLGCVCVESAVLSGKAFYCRDPDSGKLHGVNTTWASTSFCGNYTCKLRRRNETEQNPLRQISIINVDNDVTNMTVSIEKKTESDIIPIMHKNINTDNHMNENDPANLKAGNAVLPSNVKKVTEDIAETQHMNSERYRSSSFDNVHQNNIINSRDNANKSGAKNMNKNDMPKVHANMIQQDGRHLENSRKDKSSAVANSEITNTKDEKDRYLTEKEISTISEILHTVKKSDLDAIVDIYNLAQDIYKEMDEVANENLIEEAVNAIKEEELRKRVPKPTSYWYDQLANKGKMADRYDMDLQGTLLAPTGAAKSAPKDLIGLTKVPYYYPITSFQRLSSYTHVPQSTNPAKRDNVKADPNKPCKDKKKQNMYRQADYRNLIKPSLLLPYPFAYVHHYNISEYPSSFYNKPWTLDYYNRYRYYQPYNAFIAQVPNAIIVNPNLAEDVHEIDPRLLTRSDLDASIKKPKSKPDWKTGSLPREVIEDVRANVDTSKTVTYPLRKLVNIEKVGKVIKVDKLNADTGDKNKRKRPIKRSVEDELPSDDGPYETYIEKVTCQAQNIPGFFRMGNLSYPYPGCCPELIKNR